ncbi:MAG: hypothetical protein IT381_11605 [Deltaproteobacteria bacterium]|nr:hypothetical protein [Deltaproteobacteria bacterium]
MIEAAFSAPLETLFEQFDRKPLAAASIGQVYRAQFDSRSVAVKVQYPQIRETMAGDFSRLSGIARVASLATAVDGAALVEELRARIDEECDYVREAAHQTAFRRAFASDAQILIPEIVWARTRPQVLTTEFCRGDDFYSFVQTAEPPTRNAMALVLARFAFTSLFGLAAINADPHPGNYLFTDDRRVVFLDFGCVCRFDFDFLGAHKKLISIVVADQKSAFRDALLDTGMVAKPKGFDFDLHWQLLCHEYAPYRSANFRFDKSWLQRGLEFSKPGNPNLRRLAISPQWIWLERLIWGLHAVLTRLNAEADFAAVMREALACELRPLAVAMPAPTFP